MEETYSNLKCCIFQQDQYSANCIKTKSILHCHFMILEHFLTTCDSSWKLELINMRRYVYSLLHLQYVTTKWHCYWILTRCILHLRPICIVCMMMLWALLLAVIVWILNLISLTIWSGIVAALLPCCPTWTRQWCLASSGRVIVAGAMSSNWI